MMLSPDEFAAKAEAIVSLHRGALLETLRSNASQARALLDELRTAKTDIRAALDLKVQGRYEHATKTELLEAARPLGGKRGDATESLLEMIRDDAWKQLVGTHTALAARPLESADTSRTLEDWLTRATAAAAQLEGKLRSLDEWPDDLRTRLAEQDRDAQSIVGDFLEGLAPADARALIAALVPENAPEGSANVLKGLLYPGPSGPVSHSATEPKKAPLVAQLAWLIDRYQAAVLRDSALRDMIERALLDCRNGVEDGVLLTLERLGELSIIASNMRPDSAGLREVAGYEAKREMLKTMMGFLPLRVRALVGR